MGKIVPMLFHYWWIVVCHAGYAATKAVIDVKGIFLTVFGALALFGITIWNPSNILPVAWTDFLKSNSSFALIFAIAGIIVGWIIVFLLNLPYQPAALDNKQSRKIKRLGGRLADCEKEPPLDVTQLNGEEAMRLICVQIHNPSNEPITLLNVRLSMLYRVDNGVPIPIAINSSNHEFTRGDDNAQAHTIPPQQSAKIHIARAETGKYSLLLKKSIEISYADPNTVNTYSMIFSVDGYVGKCQLKTKFYKAGMDFRDWHNGSADATIYGLEKYA